MTRDDETSLVFRRVVTPAAKFWICKRTPYVTFEAMEDLAHDTLLQHPPENLATVMTVVEILDRVVDLFAAARDQEMP